jgi:mannose-6-phosphate isomerase-like protein (cupin superfamily)
MVNVVDHISSEELAMAVVTAPTDATHDIGTARFTSLATPSRGSSRETAVWRVEFAPRTPATPHSLTREEVFVVLDGEAAVDIGGTRACAHAGDAIVVPADVEFALANEGETPLRLLCCLPVGGQGRLPGGEPFTPPWAQ